MKCLLKRPPLHICKSHLPLSSNCGSRLFFELCNAIFYKCGRTSLTFVNSLFTSYSLDSVSLWPIRYGSCSPYGWGCSQLRLTVRSLPELRSSVELNATVSSRWYCSERLLRLTRLIPVRWMRLDLDETHWTDNNTAVWLVGSWYQTKCVGEMQCVIGAENWSVWTGSVKDKQQSPEHIGKSAICCGFNGRTRIWIHPMWWWWWFACVFNLRHFPRHLSIIITVWWWTMQPFLIGICCWF